MGYRAFIPSDFEIRRPWWSAFYKDTELVEPQVVPSEHQPEKKKRKKRQKPNLASAFTKDRLQRGEAAEVLARNDPLYRDYEPSTDSLGKLMAWAGKYFGVPIESLSNPLQIVDFLETSDKVDKDLVPVIRQEVHQLASGDISLTEAGTLLKVVRSLGFSED